MVQSTAEQKHEMFCGMCPTMMPTNLYTAMACPSSALSLYCLQCKHSPIIGVHISLLTWKPGLKPGQVIQVTFLQVKRV